jgi:hypothetical protein
VITSRRRVARRPAGPPVGSDGGSATTPPVEATAHGDVTADGSDPSAEDLAVDEATAVETAHVPVKRKGGRKH